MDYQRKNIIYSDDSKQDMLSLNLSLSRSLSLVSPSLVSPSLLSLCLVKQS